MNCGERGAYLIVILSGERGVRVAAGLSSRRSHQQSTSSPALKRRGTKSCPKRLPEPLAPVTKVNTKDRKISLTALLVFPGH